MHGIKLKRLLVLGAGKSPAIVDFKPGLNIIWGAANTGKSHILALIDFAFGSSTPPDPIPEQQGYEGVMLTIETIDQTAWTLCRSLRGGDIRCVEGIIDSWPTEKDGQPLSATHRPANSLSKFLLEKIEMSGVRLRKNARGETQDLSFRNIAHLVLVPEGKIQSETSPIESGQYTTRTLEFSLFKYLTTGIDDSSIQITDKQKRDRAKIAAQLELIDSQIAQADQLVRNIDQERDEIDDQFNRLDSTMDEAFRILEGTSIDYRSLSSKRRILNQSRDRLIDRVNDIELLFERFSLLHDQYASDIRRLTAIEEAASIFGALDQGPCPTCGANSNHRAKDSALVCEGDTEVIKKAAHAELAKVRHKQADLTNTVNQLQREKSAIEEEIPIIELEVSEIASRIQAELPDVQSARTRVNQVIAARETAQQKLARFHNLDNLKELRSSIVGGQDIDSVSIIAEDVLDSIVLDELSETVEEILSIWKFPGQRVFFDPAKRDIQISGKPRRANGKGVRAILHAAFSLGLLKFTSKHEKPHPKLLVLDSPLVTYRDPISDDEKKLAKSALSDRFYEAFREWDKSLQVTIIENRDPPSWILDIANTQRFTGSDTFGRRGFYPSE